MPVVGPLGAYGLAIATGVLCFLAFPGADVWPCAFVAYLPLIIAFEGQAPRRAAGIGFVAGFVMNLLGLWWLYATMRRFSDWSSFVCLLLMLVASCYQAGRVALVGWLVASARKRAWPRGPVLVAAFAAAEFVYPLIFPWYFGACVHRAPVLMQWAEVGGPILVGLILLAPALGLSHAVVARLRREPIQRNAVLAWLAVPVAAALIGQVQIWHVEGQVNRAQSVHVGLVQPNLGPPALQGAVARVQRATRLTEELHGKKVDFAVWSEGVVLGVPAADAGLYVQTLFGQRLGVPALVGALLMRGQGRGRQLLNAGLAMAADGRMTGHYEKHRLFPVGEWLPLFETFPAFYRRLPDPINFVSGTSLDPVLLAGHPVTVLICYEDLFPGFVNDAVAAGRPEMLINMTNDAWFGDSAEPWMHLALAKFRAVEHRRYLLRATNTGVSAVIDPVGRVVVQGRTFREEAIDGVAHWIKGPRTAYELWGDAPWWAITLAAGVMALRRRRTGAPA